MRINEITPPDDHPIRLKLKGFQRSPDDKPLPSPAAKWVDEIYATLPKNPLNPDQLVMLFGEGEDQQIAMFELEPTKTDPNTVYIKWFQAYPQRQGVGRKAMSKLQDMAREAGLKLNLTSWKMGKVPERVLNKFYKSMGFNPGARGLGGLTWDPKVDEAWSSSYKKSINCSNPKGFSQKAHCAARRKRAAGSHTKSKPVRESTNMHQAARSLEDYANRNISPKLDAFGDFMYHAELLKQGHPDIHQEDLTKLPKETADKIREISQQTIREDDKDDKQGELLRNVAASFKEGNPYDAMEWIEDSDFTINDIPALKAMVEANLNQIAKMVTDEMRYGQVDGHVFERIREMLENIGLEMPNDKLADLLYNAMGRIENGLRKMAMEGEYIEIAAVVYEFNHWGLSLMFEDVIDIEEDKDDIIKSMLKSMKKGHTQSVRFMVQQLRDDGIDWLELDAFEKSLAAGKQIKEALAPSKGTDLRRYVKMDGETYSLAIPVNQDWLTSGKGYWSDVVKKVRVLSITQDIEPGDDGWISDMRVEFDTETWDVDEDGLIYTDPLFIKNLRKFIAGLGVPQAIASSIDYSEQGMQDENLVSCDANEFGEYVVDQFIIGDAATLDDRKTDVVRAMLEMLKKGNNGRVSAIVQKLRELGAKWSELDTIEKSLTASNRPKLREATAGERALMRDPDSYFDTEMKDKEPLAKMRPTERGRKPDHGKTFPKIRPEEEMPDEDMVIKDMDTWGVFVLTGHFLKRMKQRKISAYQTFGIIKRVFGDNRERIKQIPSPSRFVVKDHTGLGIVVDKSEMSDGKIRYSFVTAHPKWDIRVLDRIKEATLLDKPTLTVDELATKHNVTAHDVLKELKKGVKIEQEHTSKLNVAREIALDHLGEDLYYYVKLAKAEKSNG